MCRSLLTALCFVASIASHANAASNMQAPKVPAQNMNTAPVALALPVARDGEVIDSVGGGAIEAILPVVKKDNGISYITGGIGDEETAEMKAQEPNFNVRILISSVAGEYMSEVAIRFLNKENAEVLRVNSVGPFFYVNLPAGTYVVEAASPSGTIQKAKIVAPATPPVAGKVVIRFNE